MATSFGLPYAVDPRAQGAVNLSSTNPIAKKDILFVFESALRAINVGLIKEAGGYRLTPIGDGAAYGATDSRARAQ